MDIRGEVTHSRFDPAIESTPVGKVATEAHARGADPAIARRQREQIVDGETRVLVVGSQFLSSQPAPQP